MNILPLTQSDISLWLAITAIILLISSEVLNSTPEYSSKIRIDTKRLRLAAIGCGLAFIISVIISLI